MKFGSIVHNMGSMGTACADHTNCTHHTRERQRSSSVQHRECLFPVCSKSSQSLQTSCYFDDAAFTIVSLVFTLVPLAIAVFITLIMGIIIWRFSHTMLEHTGWLFVKTKRFARFAALVFVTMISAALYTVVLSLWMLAHRAWTGQSHPLAWRATHPLLIRMIRASVLWEGDAFRLSCQVYTDSQHYHSHNAAAVLLYLCCAGRDIRDVAGLAISRHHPSRTEA